MLSLGVMEQNELALLKQPSLGYVFERLIGKSAMIITNVGLVICLLGGVLGWMMLSVQISYDVALDGSMPRAFTIENKRKTPTGSVWINGIVTQLILLTNYLLGGKSYLIFIQFATACILVPYLLSALFALKLNFFGANRKLYPATGKKLFLAAIATIYAVWLIYAAGLHYLLLSTVLYAIGIAFYWWAKKESKQKVFSSIYEVLVAVFFVVCGAVSLFYFFGIIQ